MYKIKIYNDNNKPLELEYDNLDELNRALYMEIEIDPKISFNQIKRELRTNKTTTILWKNNNLKISKI